MWLPEVNSSIEQISLKQILMYKFKTEYVPDV